MLWLWIAMLSMSYSDKPSEIQLRFTSREFLIESAEVQILHSETFAPPGDRIILPSGKTVPLPDRDNRARPLALSEGSVQNVPFSQAGKYMAMLTKLRVIRLTDRKRFDVPLFNICEFKVTESDLRHGIAEIQIEPGGIFRVVVRDKTGDPLPAKMVSFSQAESGRPITVQVKSNGEGEIIMLGRPVDFHIAAVGEGESLTLQIDTL